MLIAATIISRALSIDTQLSIHQNLYLWKKKQAVFFYCKVIVFVIGQKTQQTMSFIYNTFYALNPFRTDVSFRQEEQNELAALPDMSQMYGRYSFLGSRKQAMDPRFPRNNSDNYKKCFINFSVWRKCIEEHSEENDEEDPNAAICKQYNQLAISTCTTYDVSTCCLALSLTKSQLLFLYCAHIHFYTH